MRAYEISRRDERRARPLERCTFHASAPGIAGRRPEYSRIIDRRDELKELRWSCPTTGGFQRWLLSDAQGGTFVDMEMGIAPPAFRYGLFDKTIGRWFMRRWAEQAIDGLRRTLTPYPKA
jgi:hypothetical protein